MNNGPIDTFGNRLYSAMQLRNLNQIELSEKTKKYDKPISQSLINKYIKGKAFARQNNIYILAQILNVSEAWLMGYDLPMQNQEAAAITSYAIEVVKIPVLGKISAGVPILAEESFEGYALAPGNQIKMDKEYFYLRVQGDSMNLKFSEGTIVLVEKTEVLENGDIGIVAVNGYEATIKKYRKEGNLIILAPMSTNPEHTVQIYDISKVPVHIIGKAISYQGIV